MINRLVQGAWLWPPCGSSARGTWLWDTQDIFLLLTIFICEYELRACLVPISSALSELMKG